MGFPDDAVDLTVWEMFRFCDIAHAFPRAFIMRTFRFFRGIFLSSWCNTIVVSSISRFSSSFPVTCPHVIFLSCRNNHLSGTASRLVFSLSDSSSNLTKNCSSSSSRLWRIHIGEVPDSPSMSVRLEDIQTRQHHNIATEAASFWLSRKGLRCDAALQSVSVLPSTVSLCSPPLKKRDTAV